MTLLSASLTLAVGYLLATLAGRRAEASKAGEGTRNAAAAAQARNEVADAERAQLRVDHGRLQADHDAVCAIVRGLVEKLHLVDVAASHSLAANAAAKETLGRIDGQLTLLLNNFITRS